ncbi:MAG: alpha-L-fucosidase [Bacteroidales bacterium]|nr:alpha-L-fucosidase [Bacteroidales bacterium]
MKRTIALALMLLMCLAPSRAQQGDWHSDKYSMFIHFGLYSHFGGVWGGEPVRQGYSEQIQSFAGIFSDWYGEEAGVFDPVGFDADEIARLAKDGGMRSIVFTSKHHDGFCMFRTETTSYSSVARMPSHRDFVREMSEACARHGLRFGLYYSLIDWNYPHAYPISSHNADFVTPEHHEFSKAQVRELLTNYGPVAELWFDMGSLEPWQSRELYDLVKELQPDCMVSGRLGNDVYDFAVMADNKMPESALHAPWQSAASMFPETWSYRSWQERGEVEEKYAEKLRSLIEVVAHGGNYLLNIGPASDGSIVPFEAEVIRHIGAWLEVNGEAIYGSEPSPFRTIQEWGHVTLKGNVMYLLLSGKCPEDGLIHILDKKIKVTPDMFGKPDVEVIRLTFDRPVVSLVKNVSVHVDETLSWQNAEPDYSYSCFDYYSNYRSTVGYGWDVGVRHPVSAIELTYTSEEIGRKVRVEVGDMSFDVTLDGSKECPFESYPKFDDVRFGRMRGGVFDSAVSLQRVPELNSVLHDVQVVQSSSFKNYLYVVQVSVEEDSQLLLDVTSGNGAELVIDGRTMMKHLNPYRTVRRTEKVLVDLPKGTHEVILRSYNRFEERAYAGLMPAEGQVVYSMCVELPRTIRKGEVRVGVRAADRQSPHADCGLHNLRVRLVK